MTSAETIDTGTAKSALSGSLATAGAGGASAVDVVAKRIASPIESVPTVGEAGANALTRTFRSGSGLGSVVDFASIAADDLGSASVVDFGACSTAAVGLTVGTGDSVGAAGTDEFGAEVGSDAVSLTTGSVTAGDVDGSAVPLVDVVVLAPVFV